MTRLSTGLQLPLLQVVGVLYLTEQLLNGRPEDRALLTRLRAACLGNTAVAEPERATLAELCLVEADGQVRPEVAEVVRASVHGEAGGLFLVSPYTSPWDRALSDFIINREKIRGVLPPGEAEALIRGSLVPASEAPAPPGGWLDYILRRRSAPDGGLSPPSAN